MTASSSTLFSSSRENGDTAVVELPETRQHMAQEIATRAFELSHGFMQPRHIDKNSEDCLLAPNITDLGMIELARQVALLLALGTENISSTVLQNLDRLSIFHQRPGSFFAPFFYKHQEVIYGPKTPFAPQRLINVFDEIDILDKLLTRYCKEQPTDRQIGTQIMKVGDHHFDHYLEQSYKAHTWGLYPVIDDLWALDATPERTRVAVHVTDKEITLNVLGSNFSRVVTFPLEDFIPMLENAQLDTTGRIILSQQHIDFTYVKPYSFPHTTVSWCILSYHQFRNIQQALALHKAQNL